LDTLDVYIDEPAGRLPGGGSWGLAINGNLVWDFKPVRVKVGGSWATSRSSSQTSNPRSFLTIGSIPSRSTPQNYNAYVNVTHTISPTMFYTLSGSYTRSANEYGNLIYDWKSQADPNNWEPFPGAPEGSNWMYNPEWYQYGDPAYNPNVQDTSQGWSSYYFPWDPSFTIGADADPSKDVGYGSYGKSEETKRTGKFDMTVQLGKRHELKFGGEYSRGLYRSYSFNAFGYMWRMRNVMLDPDSYTEYDIYQSLVSMRGYDWQGNPIDDDMIVTTRLGLPGDEDINIRNAPPRPKQGGFYVTDKIELRDLIINAGLRYDYINYGHPSFSSLDSLTQGPGGVVADEHWRPAKEYHYLSPRLGFSFPVTDQAVFHAQYGKYIQAPNLSLTWTYRSYPYFLDYLYGGVYFAPLQNPNLRPEKTTNYEFGFQMQFGANASLDVTAFYKDTKDLITERVVIPRTTDYRTPTFMYNGDFGTVKGFTATFNLRRTSRIQSTLNYTYSHAQGTGSTFGEHAAIAWQEEDPHFPKIIAPLDFDQRHKGTIVIDARTQPEDGPEVLGMYPFGRIGLNLKFDFHSGSPYTRIPTGGAFSSVYGFNAPPPIEAPMSSNLPWFYQLDGKLDKTFVIGPVRLNVYLWAINLLGLKSIVDGFSQTGRPDTDGYLETDAGKERIQNIEDTYGKEFADYYVNWYNAVLTNCGTRGWQTPRQIRFGLKFEL
jgi:outer membrane receptor protein involved in Fe transport